ncbi:hypothetical protein ACUHMQ_14060 [Chitinimonas sp. PSY-7]|uniref:hypothetical protein n=1 Tax=Chitinimonas sp. PSY-7 TaxID=3459088 RepID=UPI00403FD3BF
MQDKRRRLSACPFDYLPCKNGCVQLRHHGWVVKTLSGIAAHHFLVRITGLNNTAQQQLLARATGQFKFGNEKASHAVV